MSGAEPCLLQSPRLGGAAPENRFSGSTIAFLESERPAGPPTGDANGDNWIAVGHVLLKNRVPNHVPKSADLTHPGRSLKETQYL